MTLSKNGVKIGRPTILTQDLIDKICELIGKANYVATSVSAMGISRRVFYDWVTKGTDDINAGIDSIHAHFAESIQVAFDRAETDLVSKLYDGSAGRDWQRLAWLLERTRQDRFGQRQQIDHTVTVAGPDVPVESPQTHAEWLTLRERERAILADQSKQLDAAQEAEYTEVRK